MGYYTNFTVEATGFTYEPRGDRRNVCTKSSSN